MEWLETFWATYSTLVLSIGTNVLLALSVYLTLACGLLTVANAAFMGIGGYTAALLSLHSAVPFHLSLLLGALLPAAVALVARAADAAAVGSLFGDGDARLR